jgi:hypothetical protein
MSIFSVFFVDSALFIDQNPRCGAHDPGQGPIMLTSALRRAARPAARLAAPAKQQSRFMALGPGALRSAYRRT